MDDRTLSSQGMSFSDSDAYLRGLDHVLVGQVLEVSSDVILILDSDGEIKDTSFRSKELYAGGGRGWAGRNLREIVTDESVPKIIDMLEDVKRSGHSRVREVNHMMIERDDAPIGYRAARLNQNGDIIVFGQDASRVAALQRRLMSAQLAMEREVVRLRSAEGRYRAIFQNITKASVLVDPVSLEIVDINAAGRRILAPGSKQLENTKLVNLFVVEDTDLLHKILLAAIDEKDVDESPMMLASGEKLTVNAKLFKHERKSYLLITLSPVSLEAGKMSDTAERKVIDLIDHMPDAFVITDDNRGILQVNEAFMKMFGIGRLEELEGMTIDQFFERPNVDCNVLLANMREHGIVRRFASIMRGQSGQTENVDIAATLYDFNGETLYGFWIRATSNVIVDADVQQENIARSNEQIANLVGHMPLKDIVRETAEMIENLCIETALELTNNNRASAAKMLGVSRQSLYSKLDRNKHNNGDK